MYDTREKLAWFSKTAATMLASDVREHWPQYGNINFSVTATYHPLRMLRKVDIVAEFDTLPGRTIRMTNGNPAKIRVSQTINSRLYDAILAEDGVLTEKRVIGMLVELLEAAAAAGIEGLTIENARN